MAIVVVPAKSMSIPEAPSCRVNVDHFRSMLLFWSNSILTNFVAAGQG